MGASQGEGAGMIRWFWLGIWLVMLPLAACAYDPGLRDGHADAAYAADLKACQAAAPAAADKQVKRRFYTFVTYPGSDWIAERRDVRQCLEGRGYKPEG